MLLWGPSSLLGEGFQCAECLRRSTHTRVRESSTMLYKEAPIKSLVSQREFKQNCVFVD